MLVSKKNQLWEKIYIIINKYDKSTLVRIIILSTSAIIRLIFGFIHLNTLMLLTITQFIMISVKRCFIIF